MYTYHIYIMYVFNEKRLNIWLCILFLALFIVQFQN